MSQSYEPSFKIEMVRRMTGPNAVSASRLAAEVGTSQPVLSGWLRDARAVGIDNYLRSQPVKTQAQRTPQQKMQLVLEASMLSDDLLGAFLRKHAIHQADLDAWKHDMLNGLQNTPNRPQRPSTTERNKDKRIAQLERDLDRKDKALAEAAALLILKKKALEIWGDEDESTPSKSEK